MGSYEFVGQDITQQLEKLYKLMKDINRQQIEAADDLLKLQLSNEEKLYQEHINYINRKAIAEQKFQTDVNLKLIQQGFYEQVQLDQERYEKKLQKEKELKEAGASETDIKQELAAIDAIYDAKLAGETEFQNAKAKIEDKLKKDSAKKDANIAKSVYGNLGDVLFGSLSGKTEELIDKLKEAHPEWSDEEVAEQAKKAKKDATVAATYEALANFAKKLESTIEDIGSSQAAIDTRLWGSSNKKFLGSYWKALSHDIVAYVGMSPLVKQGDVVKSLKDLVGKGIAFNVEQRAFLDTVSDKIATTFEATDATLLKLVRIQQADTTAARLGMEAALNAFLNSMYETTEYMQDAASNIRASLYEASALMGAAEGTAFEYQVQKWLGSLYSVGFNNAEGLAGALGKLVSGDISGITEGGYGNLLIMAANRAGLSIADILAKGLDDSETNRLLQSVVEYLGEIYNETKDSRVVAQQYATVYGLTASDLKAAANLYGSTRTISKNGMNYSGMIQYLQNMASSMWLRTSTGEMLNNLWDNFKYATSNSIANNPVLYAVYTIAGLLDDTVGGIQFSLPMYMGTGSPQTFKISDIMRIASLAGGFMGGMASMLSGLGNGIGSGAMLRGFGIDSTRMQVLTRGNGTGLSAMAGTSISESGSYVGNADSSDVQNKTMQDTYESENQRVEATEDESGETKLSTIDEHIVDIYTLLQSVVDGTNSLRVNMGDLSAWADVIGGH